MPMLPPDQVAAGPGETIAMTSSTPDELVELRTMFSARAAAEACAERLVTGRLAACVQIDGPVTSIYRWEGAIERTEEWRCTCKTSPERVDACRAALLAGHDYQTPEILVARVTASPAYAAWARASVEVEGGTPVGTSGRDARED
jgi:periplasmic divalent cation tolerance protein